MENVYVVEVERMEDEIPDYKVMSVHSSLDGAITSMKDIVNREFNISDIENEIKDDPDLEFYSNIDLGNDVFLLVIISKLPVFV
jgi:hypothetical protein